MNRLVGLIKCVPVKLQALTLSATTSARRTPSDLETLAVVFASLPPSLVVDMRAYSMNSANVVIHRNFRILMLTDAGLPSAVCLCKKMGKQLERLICSRVCLQRKSSSGENWGSDECISKNRVMIKEYDCTFN